MHIKIKIVPTLIMLGISLLIGYGFFAVNASEWQRWLMFGISSFEFLIILIAGFAIKYAELGNANITVTSIIFLILALIIQFVFTFISFNQSAYIILNGILILIFLGITYALARALNG